MIINNTQNNTQNNTLNNNLNNNIIINVNSFGKESLEHITHRDFDKFLGFFPGFIGFIEKIHFDELTPENHNICLTNMKSRYMHVFENDNWVLKEKNDIVDRLIMKEYNILNDKFEELEENKQIKEDTMGNFVEFIENYKNKEVQKNTKMI